MAITVTPDEFTLVEFDNASLVAVLERLLPDVGLPADADVTLNVDERVPMGRADVISLEPIVLEVEGGALEDPKKPRHLSTEGSADILGRLLLRVRDRLDDGFGDPPADDELSLGHKIAWDVYCVGRLARKGYRAQRQRRLYSFRNRHGFTDAADDAFDRLWTADNLVWADIVAISDKAVAARDTVSA
jgi:hypothetical protein